MGTVLSLFDVPATATPEGRWQALNSPLGVTTFGVNAVVMEPGEEADIEHDELGSGHQEVYVVVTGRAAFSFGAAEVEAGPGDVVAVPDPAERRSYRALEPATRIVCVGAGAGAEHPYGEWIAESASEA
jgi:mannose-6-phosphate isomerase-like protein (cupin superfamily)